MKADKLIRDPLFPITEDTDPSPLFLVYTDEDYPTEENRDLLRRCVVNQVHAHLVCDLHRQRFDEVYERSAESLLIDMTPLFSLRENAIAKEPGFAYAERWRCVS